MYGKSLKYFQLVDIVGEVDEPLKAIDMLIWAKKQHEGKEIDMKKHLITDIIASRIIRDMRRNTARQHAHNFTTDAFRKLSLLIHAGVDQADIELQGYGSSIAQQIQATVIQNPLELTVFDSEERVRDCMNEFFLAIRKPEATSVFDLSYFYGPKQTELTAV